MDFARARGIRLGDNRLDGRRMGPDTYGQRASELAAHAIHEGITYAVYISDVRTQTDMEAKNGVVIGGFALNQLIIAGASAQFGGQHFLQHANEIGAVKGHALGRDLAEAGNMVQLSRETKAAVDTVAAGGFDHAVIIHLDVDKDVRGVRQQCGEVERVDLDIF